jgi:sortase A
MRLLVSQTAGRWILRWAQRGLFAAGVLMLAYCGFVVLDAWMFQDREDSEFERLLAEHQTASGQKLQTASAGSPKLSPHAVMGALIGRIEIRRVGISVMVVEGTGGKTLRRAVGHIPGTSLPGDPGNIGISGHRDTFFRPLRNIRENDIITLTTTFGTYRYRVVSTKVVTPSDVAVLDPGADEILTLVTCYPFYFVGAAPDRFIVRAERVT